MDERLHPLAGAEPSPKRRRDLGQGRHPQARSERPGRPAHSHLPGGPGPFAHLGELRYGDAIVVHLAGQRYVFQVTAKRLVWPGNARFALRHLEGYPYLTLITCRGFDPATETYRWRWVVGAVLVSVTPEGE